MRTDEVCRRFVSYYSDQGFASLDRAPMLHPSIPMSFVMSAGLVQVETSLARMQKRPGNRFVLLQTCFRHFDLEKVGNDGLHLSLFTMPGAFEFTDSARAETIERMWSLAVGILGLDPERIWISLFGGGSVADLRLPADLETLSAWQTLGVDPERLLPLGPEANYWVQGGGIDGNETIRKCGPNTELYFDRGLKHACGPACRPGCRCGRFVEFANSLFITHQITTDGLLLPLPDPFVETVIGSERVAMLLQGADSVFDIEPYSSLIRTIRAYSDPGDLPPEMIRASERIIADFARALVTLVGDGAPPPGKNGRERIVKLLIRGIVTRLRLLVDSVEALPAVLSRASAELEPSALATSPVKRALDYIAAETERFERTLARGQQRLAHLLNERAGCGLSGRDILELEKGCGLPNPLVAATLYRHRLPFPAAEYQAALTAWQVHGA